MWSHSSLALPALLAIRGGGGVRHEQRATGAAAFCGDSEELCTSPSQATRGGALLQRDQALGHVSLSAAAEGGEAGLMTMWSDSPSTIVGGSCEFASQASGGLSAPSASSPYVAARAYCAADDALYQGGAACGACFRVTYDGSSATDPGRPGSLVVQIVDSGSAKTFDCQVDAFEAITGARTGVFPITYEPIACETAGHAVATVLDGDNAWFTKVIFSNLPDAVASATVVVAGQSFAMGRVGVTGTWSASLQGGNGGAGFVVKLASGATVELTPCFSSWPVPAGSFCTAAAQEGSPSPQPATTAPTPVTPAPTTAPTPAPTVAVTTSPPTLLPPQQEATTTMQSQPAAGDRRCCTSAADSEDQCGSCWPGAWAAPDGWCSASAENCRQCSGAWCAGDGAAASTTLPPILATTVVPDQVATSAPMAAPVTAAPTPVPAVEATSAPMEPEATPAPPASTGTHQCCTSFQSAEDKCGSCWPDALAAPDAWCSASEENCQQCSGVLCASGEAAAPTVTPSTVAPGTLPTLTTLPPAAAPTASPTVAPVVPNPSTPGQEWVQGTWTTGYWDCCKPSCSWPNKGKVNQPTLACDARTGERLTDSNVASVCGGGSAASCADNRPFLVKPRLSMGFTAIAVSGSHGLTGDANCGQCFELRFADKKHSNGNWGGAHPDLVGRSMVVQVTNIGYDVNGDHSFDLQIPGAGQGIFTDGCTAQFEGYSSGDFDCDNNYGGCLEKSGCQRLPEALRAGCEWRYDWYHWFKAGGQTNNPFVDFRRVRCPEHLTNISGSQPDDDASHPEIDFSSYDA